MTHQVKEKFVSACEAALKAKENALDQAALDVIASETSGTLSTQLGTPVQVRMMEDHDNGGVVCRVRIHSLSFVSSCFVEHKLVPPRTREDRLREMEQQKAEDKKRQQEERAAREGKKVRSPETKEHESAPERKKPGVFGRRR